MTMQCWEFWNCGREPGGARAGELGVCPASNERSAAGINRGLNGGRICWSIAGTFCRNGVRGTNARGIRSCSDCDFYRLVVREEGPRFVVLLTRVQVFCSDTHELLEEQQYDAPPLLALGEKWPVKGDWRTLTGLEYLPDDRSESILVRAWVR